MAFVGNICVNQIFNSKIRAQIILTHTFLYGLNHIGIIFHPRSTEKDKRYTSHSELYLDSPQLRLSEVLCAKRIE